MSVCAHVSAICIGEKVCVLCRYSPCVGEFCGCVSCVCVCARVHLKEIAMFSQWINDEPVFLTEPD